MPSLLSGTVGLLAVVYLAVGMYYAHRETQGFPAETRADRRHRDEEFLIIMATWPRTCWEDISNWLGW